LVEGIGDLAVDARQIVAHLGREVAALEGAQRREDLALVEVGWRKLRFAVLPMGSLAGSSLAVLRRPGRRHRSSLPYSARRILSALAGSAGCASTPASNAALRSLAWPYPVIAISRGLWSVSWRRIERATS